MSNTQALTYKYCPRSGKDLVYKSDYILKCSSCNLNFFQSFKPASSVILVTPDGRLLTAVKAIEPKKGTWDFPGGFTALDENLEEGISREMKEELNLSLAPSRFSSFLEK